MFKVRILILFLAGILLAFSSQGYSAITQHDLTSFSTVTGGYTMLTEDFEIITVTLDQNSTGTDSMVFNDFSVTSDLLSLKVLDDPYVPGIIPTDTGNYNTTADGKNFLSADTNQNFVSDDMWLNFDPDQQIFALSLNLIDIEDGGFVNINNGAANFSVAPTGNGAHVFFGIVSDTPITTVHLDMGSTDSNWSIDDVSYGAPVVPEPISSVLFVIGGSVLAGRRFMRKRK